MDARRAPLSPEILAEVRKLHFTTKKFAEQGLAGQYRSAFRGRGIEFEEVREYFPGDEIRTIDWKVTARSGKAFVKSYREERELSVMLAVDVSASTLTGTRRQLRDTLIAQIGAVLTLIALQNNDKVGLVTFSDKIDSYHPPRKARGAVWRILHEVLAPGVRGTTTDLTATLSFLNNVLKRRSVVFLISDFIADGFEQELAILAKRHDVIAVSVSDPSDFRLPDVGLVSVVHPETLEEFLLDTGDKALGRKYQESAELKRVTLGNMFSRYGVGRLELSTDRSFLPSLREFFDRRLKSSKHVHVRL